MSPANGTAYLEGTIDSQMRRFSLRGGEVCRIGRSELSTIVLNDDMASRNHAMLHNSGPSIVYLTDLGSRNGTFLNGRRISTSVALQSGDRIQIGRHEFTFHGLDSESRESAPASGTTRCLRVDLHTTVLVVDIRDFTGLAQRNPTDRIADLAGALFREAGRVLHERGAVAQKYIGDAVMAVWLHSGPLGDLRDFLNIFEAVSEMAEIAARMHFDFDLEAPVRFGAGINSGVAALGNFGSHASSDYTAIGEVVNKAFRLESATKEMRCDIALGQTTCGMLGRFIDISALTQSREVRLKGYEEPVTVFGTHLSSLAAIVQALRESSGTEEGSSASRRTPQEPV